MVATGGTSIASIAATVAAVRLAPSAAALSGRRPARRAAVHHPPATVTAFMDHVRHRAVVAADRGRDTVAEGFGHDGVEAAPCHRLDGGRAGHLGRADGGGITAFLVLKSCAVKWMKSKRMVRKTGTIF